MSIRRAYGLIGPGTGHPLSMPLLTAATVLTAVACPLRSPTVALALALVGWVATRRFEAARARALLILVLLALAATWRAGAAHDSLAPDQLGPFDGWARLVDDPQPFGGATRVIVELDDERFEAWIRGRARQQRAATWRGGQHVRLAGERIALDDERRGRVAWQHVVGELDIEWASDVHAGSGVDRASNRVRAAIERGAAVLPGDDGSLFRGLVVGDDRDQPREMIQRFRASGLSHLTAVSGVNVRYSSANPVGCQP